MKFLLTPGQTHDITQAAPLLEGLVAEQVLADKGYDGDKVLQMIHDQGGQAVIPPKSNRKVQRHMTNNCIETATTSNVSSRGSSNADASRHATTKPHATSSPSSTWLQP